MAATKTHSNEAPCNTDLAIHLKKLAPFNSPETRLKACCEITHLFYHCYLLESHLLADPKPIDTILELCANTNDPAPLRIQAFQALSNLCTLTPQTKQLVCTKKPIHLLVRQFHDTNTTIKLWAVHCAFLVLLEDYAKYQSLIHSKHFKDVVSSIARDPGWQNMFCFNDADRLLQIVNDT